MSEENVEIVRRIFPGRIDMVAVVDNPELLRATREGIEPYVDPEFETLGDPNAIPMGPDTGVKGGPSALFAKGIDGFLSMWRDWLSAWETWVLGPPEFIDVDADQVLVNYQVRARSKTGGVEVTIEAANLMTLRKGKLTRLELFFDRKNALKAAGLSE